VGPLLSLIPREPTATGNVVAGRLSSLTGVEGALSIAESVSPHLPYLRRFGRLLTGSEKSADAYVVCTLEAILADDSLLERGLPPRVALYRTFLKILNSVPLNDSRSPWAQPAEADETWQRAETLAPKARQALLLANVEKFAPAETAIVLDMDADELRALMAGTKAPGPGTPRRHGLQH
jgi:DNA-directed RNA polymerase specialized sigma24 family protein